LTPAVLTAATRASASDVTNRDALITASLPRIRGAREFGSVACRTGAVTPASVGTCSAMPVTACPRDRSSLANRDPTLPVTPMRAIFMVFSPGSSRAAASSAVRLMSTRRMGRARIMGNAGSATARSATSGRSKRIPANVCGTSTQFRPPATPPRRGPTTRPGAKQAAARTPSTRWIPRLGCFIRQGAPLGRISSEVIGQAGNVSSP
jgi:hypothetical protein